MSFNHEQIEPGGQSRLQAPVVQTLDSSIYRMNHYPRISITEINYAVRRIVIYPVDSAIQRLNNRGQAFTFRK